METVFTLRQGSEFIADAQGVKPYVRERGRAHRFTLQEAWDLVEKFRKSSNKPPIAEPVQSLF